jgi:hypothetical protein
MSPFEAQQHQQPQQASDVDLHPFAAAAAAAARQGQEDGQWVMQMQPLLDSTAEGDAAAAAEAGAEAALAEEAAAAAEADAVAAAAQAAAAEETPDTGAAGAQWWVAHVYARLITAGFCWVGPIHKRKGADVRLAGLDHSGAAYLLAKGLSAGNTAHFHQGLQCCIIMFVYGMTRAHHSCHGFSVDVLLFCAQLL